MKGKLYRLASIGKSGKKLSARLGTFPQNGSHMINAVYGTYPRTPDEHQSAAYSSYNLCY